MLCAGTRPDLDGLTLTDIVLRATGLALGVMPSANSVYIGDGVTRPVDGANVALVMRTGSSVTLSMLPDVDVVELPTVMGLRKAAQVLGGSAEIPDGSTAVGVVFNGDGAPAECGIFRTVLPPGLAALITIGGARSKIGWDENTGFPAAHTELTLSLTADARVLDNAAASAFLQAVGMQVQEFPSRALATQVL